MIRDVENFFPLEIQNEIFKVVSSSTFPWYNVQKPNLEKHPYLKTICDNDSNINLQPGFQHLFYVRGNKNCDTYINNINLLDLLTEYTEKHFDIKVRTPMRIMGLLSLPVETYNENSYLLPHVDYFHAHKTCLYYINDSDGDTFIFQEKCMIRSIDNLRDALTLLEHDNNFAKKTIDKRITPKQGKAVLFNGLNYHSGSMPRHNVRYVLNFNFK